MLGLSSIYKLQRGCLLTVMVLAISGLFGAPVVAEEAVKRSSHPRGISADGRPPEPVAGSDVPRRSEGRALPPAGASATADPGTKQTGQAGVNLIGGTRVDARVRDATAVSAGQQNSAGNRVGTVGGK